MGTVTAFLTALLQATFQAAGNAAVVGCRGLVVQVSAQFDNQLLGAVPQFNGLLDQRTQLFDAGIVHESEYERRATIAAS